jgi:hypothetical protein
VQENYYLNDEEAIEDINDGHISDGSLPSNKKDDVLDDYFFGHLNDNSSAQEEWFEEEVAEERKSPTASQEELSPSAQLELRKKSPESLCQLQESSFVHPPGETTPLAKESTAVDVCDFVVLQEVGTKPSSKTVIDLQEEDTKPLSKTVIGFTTKGYQTIK